MIIKFNQVDRQPNPIFNVMVKEKIIANGIGATQSNSAKITIQENIYEISDNIHRDKDKNGKTITQVKDIINDGKIIGRIYPDIVPQKKILFISIGYDYFVIDLYDKQYFTYEVGLGENQHYVCIYDKEELVAIIHKDDEVINFKDTYTIYFQDEKLLTMLCIFNLYFDCINYPNHGEIMGDHVEDGGFITVNKELNSKYDPTFIKKIIDLENH